MTEKQDKPRETGRPADYGEATPEEVAKALLTHTKPTIACCVNPSL